MEKKKWTKEEENFLKENFYKMTREELAKEINTSKSSITNKMFSLNLKNWDVIPKIYQNLTKMELSYLAGLLDGEGSIMLVKQKKENTTIFYEPRIAINNCSLLFRDWFKKRGFFVRRENRKEWQIKYITIICGYKIKHLLKLLIPYLVLKKPQAYLMVNWIEERQTKVRRSGKGINFTETKKMEELREQIKLLNSKNREELYQLEKEIIRKYTEN